MLKLKLQYFGHPMWIADSLEKSSWCWERLRAEGEEGIRGWDGWMSSLMQWTWIRKTLGGGEGQGGLACCCPWDHKESDTTGWLNNNISKNKTPQFHYLTLKSNSNVIIYTSSLKLSWLFQTLFFFYVHLFIWVSIQILFIYCKWLYVFKVS